MHASGAQVQARSDRRVAYSCQPIEHWQEIEIFAHEARYYYHQPTVSAGHAHSIKYRVRQEGCEVDPQGSLPHHHTNRSVIWFVHRDLAFVRLELWASA